MKKTLALLLALVLVLGMFTACAKQSETETTTDPATSTTEDTTTPEVSFDDDAEKPTTLSDETVTIALSAEPNTLIPAVAFTSNDVSLVMRMMYEPLIAQDYESAELSDTGLALSWEDVDDTSFRLTLRQGVKFTNGQELTTADVVYLIQEGQKGAMATYFTIFDLENSTVEDDYNIVLKLSQPWAQAKELLAYNYYMIPCASSLEEIGGAATTTQYMENAGTGKYVFKEWVPGEYIMLERNENYWNQEDMGYFKNVKFVFINDATARAMAVKAGDVDIATGVNLSDYALYSVDDTVRTVLLPQNNVSTLFLNSAEGKPLNDVRVREAIYWLVDKAALQAVGASGFGELCDTIIAKGGPMWDGIDESSTKVVDVEKAKSLLAEAGYPDGLTLVLRGNSSTATATLLQEQLRAGGIDMQIVTAETPVHFAALAEGDFDMYISSQQYSYYTEAVRCTDGLTYSFADVMGGCGYQNEEYSEICARCYATSDLEERKAAYADLQAMFREQFVSIGLYTNVVMSLTRSDIAGMDLFGLGIYDCSSIYSTNG